MEEGYYFVQLEPNKWMIAFYFEENKEWYIDGSEAGYKTGEFYKIGSKIELPND